MTHGPTAVVGPRLVVDISSSRCHASSLSFSNSSHSSQPDSTTRMEARKIQQTLLTSCIAAPHLQRESVTRPDYHDHPECPPQVILTGLSHAATGRTCEPGRYEGAAAIPGGGRQGIDGRRRAIVHVPGRRAGQGSGAGPSSYPYHHSLTSSLFSHVRGDVDPRLRVCCSVCDWSRARRKCVRSDDRVVHRFAGTA